MATAPKIPLFRQAIRGQAGNLAPNARAFAGKDGMPPPLSFVRLPAPRPRTFACFRDPQADGSR